MILSIRPDDEGVFFCSAENPAGIATANFTVKVIDEGESLILSTHDKNQPGAASNNVIEVVEETEESNMFKVRFFFDCDFYLTEGYGFKITYLAVIKMLF